jgi:hypothetical protein
LARLSETLKLLIFIYFSCIALFTPSVFLPESFAPSAEINLFPECYALTGPFA